MTDELKFAVEIAEEAGKIMKQNFSLGMKKEWKEDGTPLTASDTEINALVLGAVANKYPSHSFLGEEGSRIADSEYTWVCDPVDGTVPFSHGYPTFTFSLALTRNGESMLGVIYDPIGRRLLHAKKGSGAYLNGEKISTAKFSDFSRKTFVAIDCDFKLAVIRERLIKEGCFVPAFYSCVYASMLVASGEFAAEIYEYDKPWDAAAVKIIVEEAGGRVTSLTGKEQRYDKPINGFIASNGALHQKLLDIVAPFAADSATSFNK